MLALPSLEDSATRDDDFCFVGIVDVDFVLVKDCNVVCVRELWDAEERVALNSRHTSQDAKVDLKPLIISVILIYDLSDTINLFCVLVFILINKLITFSAS